MTVLRRDTRIILALIIFRNNANGRRYIETDAQWVLPTTCTLSYRVH